MKNDLAYYNNAGVVVVNSKLAPDLRRYNATTNVPTHTYHKYKIYFLTCLISLYVLIPTTSAECAVIVEGLALGLGRA
jgi:hypothetical protein